jgi:hypothetical protein
MWLCVLVGVAGAGPGAAGKKKKDKSGAQAGTTPFWLRDPVDQMCLGPNGFTWCDASALWLFEPRGSGFSLVSFLSPNPYEHCMVRRYSWLPWSSQSTVSGFKCSHKGAKSWDIKGINGHYEVSQNRGKMCLVRGQRKYKNSISMLRCEYVHAIHSTVH